MINLIHVETLKRKQLTLPSTYFKAAPVILFILTVDRGGSHDYVDVKGVAWQTHRLRIIT